ncbi:MAG: preprotein translocase subunit SecE [Patescibacteria group bacterium]
MFRKLQNYISESMKELKKVSWLNLAETWRLTLQVVLFAVIFSAIYGIADFVFLKLIFIK